jgi:hypothetical protein
MSVPSLAAQVIISIIPIVGIVMGSFVAFFYLLWNHREKLILIERGLYVPARVDLDTFSLLAGLLLSAVGLALSILLFALDGITYGLLGGVLPLVIGASLLGFFSLRGKRIGA